MNDFIADLDTVGAVPDWGDNGRSLYRGMSDDAPPQPAQPQQSQQLVATNAMSTVPSLVAPDVQTTGYKAACHAFLAALGVGAGVFAVSRYQGKEDSGKDAGVAAAVAALVAGVATLVKR